MAPGWSRGKIQDKDYGFTEYNKSVQVVNVPPTITAMTVSPLIVNLGAPFLIRAGNEPEATRYVDGCVVTTPTRAFGVRLPDPAPVRRRALQAVGAGAVPADARGRAV